MASFVGINHRVYLNHLDLSGNVNQVDFGTITTATKDATTFNDGGFMCPKPALMSGAAKLSGLQDFTAGVLDSDISIGQLGTQYPILIAPTVSGTSAAADPCYFSRGDLSDLSPLMVTKGEMAGFELGLTYDTALIQGKIAAPKAAQTTTTTGTAVALTGPTATQRLWAVLHVFAYSGLTNAVFTIQSDDNVAFPSQTTRLTFTTVTATGGQFASAVGPWNTETHHRVLATLTGVGSITYAVAFGVL